MGEFFTLSVLVATAASAIRLATPYLLASLGETVGQRSGVLNLGVDGVMLLSAFFSYWTVLETGNLWLAVLVGLVVGLVMGLLYGVITVFLNATQGISGIGIFIFGLGLSDLLFRQLVGTPKPVRRLPNVDIPLLSDIPHLGEALFQRNLLTYLAFLLVPVTALLLTRTTFGLNIRSVGDNPRRLTASVCRSNGPGSWPYSSATPWRAWRERPSCSSWGSSSPTSHRGSGSSPSPSSTSAHGDPSASWEVHSSTAS